MGMVFTDSILKKDNLYAMHSPTIDLSYGGQFGFLPRIGLVKDNKNYAEWIANQAYIRRNIIPVLLQAPRFFDFLPESQKWVRVWKSLLEDQPLSIEGLSSGLTVETDEHPIGGGGESQEEITDVKRARSSVNMSYQEKAGKAITKFLDFFIRYGMMDPDTKTPLISRYFKSIEDIGYMYTPDFYASTIIFIEPDITNKVVNDAWLCTNFFPKGSFDRTGKRDVKSGGEKVEFSIEFASITSNNEATLRLADYILGNLTVLNKIPDLDILLPLTGQEPNVEAVDKQAGFNR